MKLRYKIILFFSIILAYGLVQGCASHTKIKAEQTAKKLAPPAIPQEYVSCITSRQRTDGRIYCYDNTKNESINYKERQWRIIPQY